MLAGVKITEPGLYKKYIASEQMHCLVISFKRPVYLIKKRNLKFSSAI